MSSWPSASRLFVYGTLRHGFDNCYARLLDRTAKYLGAARVRGRLYDLGHYPGIQLQGDPAEWVTGDLFALPNPKPTLVILDEYEGPAFERVTATAVLPSGSRIRCWVYEYRWPLGQGRRILSGDYLEEGM